jgi:hypothetical protein
MENANGQTNGAGSLKVSIESTQQQIQALQQTAQTQTGAIDDEVVVTASRLPEADTNDWRFYEHTPQYLPSNDNRTSSTRFGQTAHIEGGYFNNLKNNMIRSISPSNSALQNAGYLTASLPLAVLSAGEDFLVGVANTPSRVALRGDAIGENAFNLLHANNKEDFISAALGLTSNSAFGFVDAASVAAPVASLTESSLLSRSSALTNTVEPSVSVAGSKIAQPGDFEFSGPLSPSQLAKSWQGSGAYPGVDSYINTTLPKGTYVVGSAPGQSPYYTTLEGFAGTNGTAEDFYQQLQISPNLTNPAYPPYRNGVTIYETTGGSTPAASGSALANPQFGPGKAPQLFIPGYNDALTPVYSIPFKM